MRQFDPIQFFHERTDFDVQGEDYSLVFVNEQGRKLVAEYYQQKYQTDIVIPASKRSPDYPMMISEFIASSPEILVDLRKDQATQPNLRRAFIVGDSHITPIIYLRENGQECFFVPDSSNYFYEADASDLAKNSQIPVFTLLNGRQRDYVSCSVDALVFARDITRKDSEQIPNLYDFINDPKNNVAHKNFFFTRLPNQLLKTAQRASFIKAHLQPGDTNAIHKSETIEQFRKRYSSPLHFRNPISFNPEAPTYLTQKGLKMRHMIELQFYANQLRDQLGPDFDEQTYKTAAEHHLHDLYTFSQHYANQPSPAPKKP